MPFLGAHMSIAGGPDKALLRGSETGCKVVQMFTRHRLKWSAKGLSGAEIDTFKRRRAETSVLPIALHCSYLINLASPFSDKRERSFDLFLKEIEWATLLDIPYIVIHPGSHLGSGEAKAIGLIAEMINRATADSEDSDVIILLETTAGQGTNIGFKFEHFAEIFESIREINRVGVCFDTCHTFAAGYDFRSKETYRQIMEKFDSIIGLKRLRLFHINDSKTNPGSMIDRHDHPGKGKIGLKVFSYFLNDPEFKNHPFILETPKGEDEKGIDLDIVNMRRLKRLIKKELD